MNQESTGPEHLSQQLQLLIQSMDESPSPQISIREIEERLKRQSVAMILIILSLPFVQPIPLPGLSMILGFLIVALGLKVAFGEKGALPEFVARRELPEARLKAIIIKVLPLLTKIERLFKPRLLFCFSRRFHGLIGFFIMISGTALMLPLPPVILFSNSIPAWAIIFISLGLLEKDGLMLWIGHILAAGAWIYFYTWWEVIKVTIEKFFLH